MKGRQIMVLKCHRFFIEQSKCKAENKIKPETPGGWKNLRAKWHLEKYQNVSTKNDEVASKVLSGPGPIDQKKGPPQSKLRWSMAARSTCADFRSSSDYPVRTLEHRYKKLHQSNKLDCSVTHTLFSFILKHYSFSLFWSQSQLSIK